MNHSLCIHTGAAAGRHIILYLKKKKKNYIIFQLVLKVSADFAPFFFFFLSFFSYNFHGLVHKST